MEIGYWIDAHNTRRGYATEAAGELTAQGFGMPDVDHIEIRCDPRNAASSGVAKKLGFEHIATLVNDTTTPAGDPRDTMVWALARSAYEARQTTTIDSFR